MIRHLLLYKAREQCHIELFVKVTCLCFFGDETPDLRPTLYIIPVSSCDTSKGVRNWP